MQVWCYQTESLHPD